MNSKNFDVIILGAGGAGMMCAIHAGRRGRKVLLIDHAHKIGGKILISGGGRCNFTNTAASPEQYVSKNKHFCKSALSRFTPDHFIQMVEAHGIAYHEKKLGQLFCDESAHRIVALLKSECEQAGAQFKLGFAVSAIRQLPASTEDRFAVEMREGDFKAQSLVIATGGLSIPKIGASGFGYEIARQFDLKIVPTDPALDGFVFNDADIQTFRELAGISIDCLITCGDTQFRENILFTHSGLSGPAALQASLHWHRGKEVVINLLPEVDLLGWFLQKKKEGNRSQVKNLLGDILPQRFSEKFCSLFYTDDLPLPQVSEKTLELLSSKIHQWTLLPSGTMGYHKAEVTRGGVDTDELSSKTMETRNVPGLYFVGEVVDVTGWLGGYNFQWAWASGWAAGQVV